MIFYDPLSLSFIVNHAGWATPSPGVLSPNHLGHYQTLRFFGKKTGLRCKWCYAPYGFDMNGRSDQYGWHIVKTGPRALSYGYVALSAPPPKIITQTIERRKIPTVDPVVITSDEPYHFTVNVTSAWNIPIQRVILNIGASEYDILDGKYTHRTYLTRGASIPTDRSRFSWIDSFMTGNQFYHDDVHDYENSPEWQNGAHQYGKENIQFHGTLPALPGGTHYYTLIVQDMAGGIEKSEIVRTIEKKILAPPPPPSPPLSADCVDHGPFSGTVWGMYNLPAEPKECAPLIAQILGPWSAYGFPKICDATTTIASLSARMTATSNGQSNIVAPNGFDENSLTSEICCASCASA